MKAYQTTTHLDPQNPGNFWIFSYYGCDQDPCHDLDDGIAAQTRAALDSGELEAFDVTATYHAGSVTGQDHLGACIYKDVDDFEQPGDYFDDMKQESREEAQRELQAIRQQPDIVTEAPEKIASK